MTRDQQLEAVRAKCIEANPEIVELKLGAECRYTIPAGRKIKELALVRVSKTGRTALCATYDTRQRGWSGPYFYEIEKLEVIGRPVRLADVLYAYEQQDDVAHSEFKRERVEILNRWCLVDDDLRDQSDETVDYLYSLLA